MRPDFHDTTFAKTHAKKTADIEQGDYSKPVKQGYELIKDLPTELEEKHKDSLISNQISHAIQGNQALTLAQGKAKLENFKAEIEAKEAEVKAKKAKLVTEIASQLNAEKRATAQSLVKRGGLAPDEIAMITGLSLAEIAALQP